MAGGGGGGRTDLQLLGLSLTADKAEEEHLRLTTQAEGAFFWLRFGRKGAACDNYKHARVHQHVSGVKMRHLNLFKVQVQPEALIKTWLMMAPDNGAQPPDPCGLFFTPAFFFVLAKLFVPVCCPHLLEPCRTPAQWSNPAHWTIPPPRSFSKNV